MPRSDAGQKALAHVDTARAAQPKKDDGELSAALRCLSAYRDEAVTAHRAAPDALTRTQLDHLNAVISSVMAVQFPLGEVPWEELHKARGWLAAILESQDA